MIDVTRMVEWQAPQDLAEVTETGFLTVKADGAGEVLAKMGEHSVSASLRTEGTQAVFKPDYVQDVNPVISRMGCNQGTCHGAKDGKNGFKLSLRGYDPIFDLRSFTDDLASRRVNLASPDDSLMLLKATAAVPHEGGQLCKPNSPYYDIVRAWIADGVPYDAFLAEGKEHRSDSAEPSGAADRRTAADACHGHVRRWQAARCYTGSICPKVAIRKSLKFPRESPALVKVLRRGEAPVLVRFEGAYAATTITAMGDRTGFVWQDPPSLQRNRSPGGRQVAAHEDPAVGDLQRLRIRPPGVS